MRPGAGSASMHRSRYALPGLDAPDGQIGIGLFSMDTGGVDDHPGMTTFGYFMHPQSRGHVRI